ncbi:MAG TPA: uroporphyrinogen decarboxylase [Pseudonocardiaceae bacterium]|nr:uroporphyrinogen decarboxylase [Pseudonocardiaceae bacterium]
MSNPTDIAPVQPPVSAPGRRDLPSAPLLAAARGERPATHPVWFMRQAGRSLPEYWQLRAQHADLSMLQTCLTPEVAAEITLQPVRRHQVDAAILFSDIVVPLYAAGVGVEIVKDRGPVMDAPIRTAADVAALPRLHAEQVGPVADTVRLLIAELGDTPLIGFAGAPFTLASYLVEGGPSKDHGNTKALMYGEPDTWHALADKLADIALTFLRAQIDAGVDAIQLFDSWAGTLSERDYREFVLPHSRKVFAGLADTGVPRIHFGVGTGELLGVLRQAGPDVVGIDWRVPLDTAVDRLTAAVPDGPAPVVQGNLDPTVLLADWSVVERETRRVVAEGAAAGGHIVNLGHGVLPRTDPDVLSRLTELVHSIPVED